MGLAIERFLAVLREYSAQLDEQPTTAHSLVMARTGGFFRADDAGMAEAHFREMQGEDITETSEEWVRRWLEIQVAEGNETEAEYIKRIVQEIDDFLEETIEDWPKRRKEAREKRDELAAKLADPSQADKVIAKMNEEARLVSEQFGFPLGPEVTRYNALERMDLVNESFLPAPSLERLQELRKQLDVWRDKVMPIFQE